MRRRIGSPAYEQWYALELTRIDLSIAIDPSKTKLDNSEREVYRELYDVLTKKCKALRRQWGKGTKR